MRGSGDALSYILSGRDELERPFLYARKSFHNLPRLPEGDLASSVAFADRRDCRAAWVNFKTLFLASRTSRARLWIVSRVAPWVRAMFKVFLVFWRCVWAALTSGDRDEYPEDGFESPLFGWACGLGRGPLGTAPSVASAASWRAASTAAFACFAYSSGPMSPRSSFSLRDLIVGSAFRDFVSTMFVNRRFTSSSFSRVEWNCSRGARAVGMPWASASLLSICAYNSVRMGSWSDGKQWDTRRDRDVVPSAS